MVVEKNNLVAQMGLYTSTVSSVLATYMMIQQYIIMKISS